MRTGRSIAAVAAMVGWTGLALQLVLIAKQFGPASGAWRFVGYFTVLTNLGAAVVASALAAGRKGKLAGPRGRLMAATSMVIVGIVYSVALRALWHPTGLQKVADLALHDAAPLLFLTTWLSAPHSRLPWREVGWALLPPALYAGYALTRGAADGWYAYWFLDPSKQTMSALFTCMTVMLAAFAGIAALLVAVDRWLGVRLSN